MTDEGWRGEHGGIRPSYMYSTASIGWAKHVLKYKNRGGWKPQWSNEIEVATLLLLGVIGEKEAYQMIKDKRAKEDEQLK